MVANCIVGVCITVLCAAPVLGEEGNAAKRVQVSKYLELNQPLQRRPEALPQVRVKEKTQYYDIYGATSDELRAQMKHNGTTWNDGRIYAALTTWDIRYHYEIASVNGGYRLSAIGTDVDIVFHLPRLAPSARTPEQLALTWSSYLDHLMTHEFGHRDIAVDIGQEIYQSLSSLGSCTSKSELDRQAQDLVEAKFRKLKQAQIDYDAETHHGIKQGAVLHDPVVAASVPAS